MEIIFAMPLITVLLIALGTSFAFGLRSYLFLLGDWTLEEEVSYAMERMTSDLRYAEDVKIEGAKLRVLCRLTSGPATWVEYEKTNEEEPRIRRDRQPLTGESKTGRIAVRDFELRLLGERTIYLRISGENLITGRTFELATAVTWTGKET